jgi:ABC-type transport system substrate-binding protein
MKESLVILAVLIASSMLTVVLVPTKAWEYWNTTIAAPQTDNLVDFSGPHADRLQIRLFSNEGAEFAALECGYIDVTDWPLDKSHYTAWTTDDPFPLQQDIAVVNTGPEFGMYILDMRMDNRTEIAPGVPNPARTAPFGNPMADVWLRRAIACVVDRKTQIQTIVSGGSPPWLGEAMYTPLSSAYGAWQHLQLNPTGALAAYAYVKPDGSADVAKGNQYLDDHGYTIVAGKRTKGGGTFTIQFYYRTDEVYRNDLATYVMWPLLTQAPPNGLGLDVQMIGVTSAGGREEVMAAKKGHLYTGGWGLTSDPDHLYYLFHINNYWHPGRPLNYMYYPGDANKYNIAGGGTYDGRGYGNDLVPYGANPLNFTDDGKTWSNTTYVWENPQNYWSWEMMIATNFARSQYAAYKSQEAIAYLVCGVPVWAAQSYTAFHRRYVGTLGVPDGEDQWEGQPWKGVVDQKGLGVWSTMSFYDMHPANALFGDGSHLTIRWGFRRQTMSLNPIYAEWVWDWYVLNQAYDSLIGLHPYKTDEIKWLAHNWSIGTWNSSQYGMCTKITFNLRHDVLWSDGMPLTVSDLKFSWGGPLVTGSLSNLLAKKGYPPAYWSSQVADILSIATPDPWTVIVYLDVFAYFGLHSMSGFNIVLPEHIWKTIINTGDPTQPWNQPCVVTGGYTIDSTADPAPVGYIMLHKNPLHFNVQSGDAQNRDRPISIWGVQTSNATAESGNTHWIYPRQGQTGVTVTVDMYLDNRYFYETGPCKADVDPNTVLSGLKTVTLWKWDRTGKPSDESKYVLYRTIATDVPFAAQFCVPEVETFVIDNLPACWYLVKFGIVINGGSMSNASNPYLGMTYSYTEKMLITSRYDTCGDYYKPLPTPTLQPIADLKTNVKDMYYCNIAYGSIPGYANWNPAADVNNDLKINVKDLFKIAQNYGWVAP